ncbi:MAG: imidazole glycerol phosphate synthase subunit HisH [Clostridia bacterium]|nr:imidazole glycerol phosphate synthase subunit HisH [Clostridia bacterium]
MVVIVDYGVGNLFSIISSFRAIGVEAVATGDIEVIRKAERILLPGVGAFEDAAKKLFSSGLAEVIIEKANSGTPLLGICLGMQLLFDKSYEYGEHKGLGLIPGEIKPLSGIVPSAYKIPHIGWNALTFPNPHPLFERVKEGECVYFVHSYYAVTAEKTVIAQTEYGAPVTAAVASGNVYGCQFHPEKSGETGLNVLRAFSQMEAKK